MDRLASCRNTRKWRLLLASTIVGLVIYMLITKCRQYAIKKKSEERPQPPEHISALRILEEDSGLSNFCHRCRSYLDVPITNLSRCTPCYEEIQDESTQAKTRNKLLLEYHARSTTATKLEQRLPDIIGIGVRKCGTGFLNHVLRKHPMIKGSSCNELHFFNHLHNYERGMDYYRSQMPNVTEFELVMEKTPGYFNFPHWKANIPKLIRSHLPNAKLWLILCDPVRRSISDFVQVTTRRESPLPPTFEEYVEQYLPKAERTFSLAADINDASLLWSLTDHSSVILSIGIYHSMMKEWLKYFPAEQIHVISGEELIRNPGAVILKIQDFLVIPRFLLPEDFEKNPKTGLYCISPTFAIDSKLYRVPRECVSSEHKGRTRGIDGAPFPVYDDVLRRLEEFYKPYNEELFRILGRRLW